jgi:hypothetical protein
MMREEEEFLDRFGLSAAEEEEEEECLERFGLSADKEEEEEEDCLETSASSASNAFIIIRSISSELSSAGGLGRTLLFARSIELSSGNDMRLCSAFSSSAKSRLP